MDRISQVQSLLDRIAIQFINSVSIIQNNTSNININTDAQSNTQDVLKKIAYDIVKTSTLLDTIIDSLPKNTSEEEQIEEIERLCKQDQEVSTQVRETVSQAEVWLGLINDTLTSISEDRLTTYEYLSLL